MSHSATRRKLDPVATHRTILLAATEQFSERGYAGTSFADVAKRAGVAKGLVQYHFATKEVMWQAVVGSRIEPLLARIDQFLDDPSNPHDVLRARFEIMNSDPVVTRLMGWAALEPTPLAPELKERGKRMGEQYASAPAAVFPEMFFTIAAMDGWLVFRHLYAQVTGIDLTAPAISEAFMQGLLAAAEARRKVK